MSTVKAKKKTLAKPTNRVSIPAGKKIDLPKKDLGSFTLHLSQIVPTTNYRRTFNESKIKELASSIKSNGLLQSLLVRPCPDQLAEVKAIAAQPGANFIDKPFRFQLVAGGRRYRALQIAELAEVPVIIRDLTDEEVIEAQLNENKQREDPHPMDDAYAIADLKKTYKSKKEIALRLGKSEAWVYTRLNLLNLIQDIQEIFVSDRITITEASKIADLSLQSQEAFFNQYLQNWKEEDDWELSDLDEILSRYKFDLSKAPFNTKDDKLVPSAGACTRCPHNSASLKTLFPEEVTTAVCNKIECFWHKCATHCSATLKAAIGEHKPQAIVMGYGVFHTTEDAISLVPELAALPRYERHQITRVEEPKQPDKDDYYEEDGSEEEGQTGEFDEFGYKDALTDYEIALEEYKTLMENGKFLVGLFLQHSNIDIISFNPDPPQSQKSEEKPLRAVEVQHHIKAGTATRKMLQAEIDRIDDREIRSKELDAEKIQVRAHADFEEYAEALGLNRDPTPADEIAGRLLIYQSLGYSERSRVDRLYFPSLESYGHPAKEKLYEVLTNMKPAEVAYMTRLAIAGKAESKLPHHITGYCLYQMAPGVDVDVKGIEETQHKKATTRNNNKDTKVAILQARMAKFPNEAD